KYIVRPAVSPEHTTMTSFARSTPTVVISLMSSPSLVQIDATHAILALDAERLTPFQGRGTPLYSVGADRIDLGACAARARREIVRARAAHELSAGGRSTGSLCVIDQPSVAKLT